MEIRGFYQLVQKEKQNNGVVGGVIAGFEFRLEELIGGII